MADKELSEVLAEAANNDFQLPEDDSDEGNTAESEVPEGEGHDDAGADGSDDASAQDQGGTASAESEQVAQRGEQDAGEDDDPFADTSWLDNKEIKEETRKRFNALLEDRKKLKLEAEQRAQEYSQAQEQLRSWQQRMEYGMMDQQDMDFMVEANRRLKSTDPAVRSSGYQMIKQLHDNLSQQLGYQTENFDPLSRYPDLQQRVQKYQIGADDARELARARIQQELAQQHTAQTERTQLQRGQMQQVVDQASQSVVEFEQHMQKSDPDYKAKQPYLVDAMKDLLANRVDPRSWPQLIANEYRRVSQMLEQRAKDEQQVGRRPNPLRPTGSSAAGTAREAKDMMEALTNGLEDMRNGAGR